MLSSCLQGKGKGSFALMRDGRGLTVGSSEYAGSCENLKPCRYWGAWKPLATGAPAFSAKGPPMMAFIGSASTDAAGGPAGGAGAGGAAAWTA